MKTILLAAAAALSLGVSAAYADGGQSPVPNSYFTELPGEIAHAPVQRAPSAVATSQAGANVNVLATTHHSTGTWLFPPDQFGGGDN
jgi:hypothetical protein